MRRLLFGFACCAATSCASGPAASYRATTSTALAASAQQRVTPVIAATELPCRDHAEAVLVVDVGIDRGFVCPDDARAKGLTIVDLTDTWTPSLFAPNADGLAPSYRATYLAHAAEHTLAGKPLTGEDALGELYGVVPALSVVRARLADDARHQCNAAIDTAPIALASHAYSQDDRANVALAEKTRLALAAGLERERVRRKLDTLDELAEVPAVAKTYARYQQLADQHAAITAVQARLQCEGFLGAKEDAGGQFGWRTGNALELFQRRNFLMPDERLDPETRDAMQLDAVELDFRLALRVLRERVTDGSGLIEDGTAGAGSQPILGRVLDPDAMREARGGKPLPDGAPDLVGAATEAAAQQLGWTDAAGARAFFARHAPTKVALRLPALPAYYAAPMALSAEVDRGDVWYDEHPIPRRVAHRPTLILYVDDHGTRRPLVRWPTTIGGWADQRLADGSLVQRWKESDVGPRVWRDLYAAPTWLPPPTTPDRDLVTNLWNGRYDLKRSVMGPGPHAAYGMMLLVHHQIVHTKTGDRFDDNGIGTHGSASVTSIVNGTSHGCHRLYNQLAVRLADFLLRHHDHVAHGEEPVAYRRLVRFKGDLYKARIDTRGFRYELTPPIAVNVLRGNILSQRKVPPRDSAPARP
jgi:hypothetical protein